MKRPYSIAIRLSRNEYAAIKRHAKKRDEPPSTWAREALMETLGMGHAAPAAQEQPVSEVRAATNEAGTAQTAPASSHRMDLE